MLSWMAGWLVSCSTTNKSDVYGERSASETDGSGGGGAAASECDCGSSSSFWHSRNQRDDGCRAGTGGILFGPEKE